MNVKDPATGECDPVSGLPRSRADMLNVSIPESVSVVVEPAAQVRDVFENEVGCPAFIDADQHEPGHFEFILLRRVIAPMAISSSAPMSRMRPGLSARMRAIVRQASHATMENSITDEPVLDAPQARLPPSFQ